jgi:putative transposase
MFHVYDTKVVHFKTSPEYRRVEIIHFSVRNHRSSPSDADDKLYAPARYGCPSICNTDQGSQFTSSLWIDELKANGIKISMAGKGRWMDNVFIERLWRSLKYECVYLNAFDDLKDAKAKLNTWIEYYNHERPHSSLNDQTPNEFYEGIEPLSLAA